jgi:hypothetical protein
MSVKEAVLAALKELILPELQIIRQEQTEVKATLALTNKRLDDVNAHLVDQSRRIDTLGARIDDTNKRLDRLYEVIVRREEHHGLEVRVSTLEQEVSALKKGLAA